MATIVYEGRVWVGVSETSVSNTPYSLSNEEATGSLATLPSNIVGNATVDIIVRSSSFSNDGRLVTTAGSGNQSSKFYLCDYQGNNAVEIETITLAKGDSIMTARSNPKTVNIRGLAGKTMYMKEVTNGNPPNYGVHIRGDCAIKITYTTGAKVQTGDPILATDYTQTGGSASRGGSLKLTGTFSSGTEAKASTFNSTVLGL